MNKRRCVQKAILTCITLIAAIACIVAFGYQQVEIEAQRLAWRAWECDPNTPVNVLTFDPNAFTIINASAPAIEIDASTIVTWSPADPNATLDLLTFYSDMFDESMLFADTITITTTAGCDIEITYDGILDVKGDPNCMTEAAWIFFDEYLRDIVDLYTRDHR